MSAKVAPPQLKRRWGKPIEEKLQKLFGSITNRDLAKVLRDSDIKIEHRRVSLAEPVRTVGKFEAKVRLDGGVIAVLPFWVIPEGAADVEVEKEAGRGGAGSRQEGGRRGRPPRGGSADEEGRARRR